MRLWHYKLLPFLPNSQLVSQWRELNSIFKNQNKHILINYIYEYDKQVLYNYTQLVLEEMNKRDYNIKSWNNYHNYFSDADYNKTDSMFDEHNFEYLTICYYNLYEKFLRKQKDFARDNFLQLYKFYKEEEKKGKFNKL